MTSVTDKISTGIALVVTSLVAFIVLFTIVWLCSLGWNIFPIGVKVFIVIVALIPSYLIAIGLYGITCKILFTVGERRFYVPTEDGIYIEERGRLKAYPSLRNQSALKQLGTKITEVENVLPDIPRLSQLIQDEMLFNDAGEVLLGYRSNGTPRYGNWPSVFAMTGIGNSGKSVSMVLFIVIAILLGYEVVVCDPHKTKDRSLYKKLQLLEGYITFAFTADEILKEAKKFSHELQQKKDGYNLDTKKLLVIDELTSLVKRNAAISKQLVTVVEESSQEGIGYHHNLMLACHTVTEDGLGDVAIRNALNGVFCHRLDTDQSKYVIKDKKFNRRSGNLPSGHVFYRDEGHEIEYLIMPFSDSTDMKEVLRVLQTKGMLPSGNYVTGTIAYNSVGALSGPSTKQQTEVKHPVNKPLEPLYPNPIQVSVDTDQHEAIHTEERINNEDVNTTVKLIHRMRKRNIPHRDIAYTIGLYGAKWSEYQKLCEQHNIPLKEDTKTSEVI